MENLNYTTRDNQKIEKDTKIYYTGDMANNNGYGIVIDITPCDWYKLAIHIKMDDGREFNLTPMSFEPGPGVRFITKEKHINDRVEGIKKLYENMKLPFNRDEIVKNME